MDKQVGKVDYISTAELKPYDEKTNFLQIMRQLTNSITDTPEVEWTTHFANINELRRLRKYHCELLLKMLDDLQVKKHIGKYVNSVRSNVSKLALIFLKEIFSVFEFDKLNKCMKYFIPDVLSKSVSDKSFIRDEALGCLKNISENMFYCETLFHLLNGVLNPNLKISENAFKCLSELIENFDLLCLVYTTKWDVIFKRVILIHQKKKDPYVKKAARIGNVLKHKLGEYYENILKDNLSDEELGLFEKIVKIDSTINEGGMQPLREHIKSFLVNKTNK